jgi:hypothetical protein
MHVCVPVWVYVCVPICVCMCVIMCVYNMCMTVWSITNCHNTTFIWANFKPQIDIHRISLKQCWYVCMCMCVCIHVCVCVQMCVFVISQKFVTLTRMWQFFDKSFVIMTSVTKKVVTNLSQNILIVIQTFQYMCHRNGNNCIISRVYFHLQVVNQFFLHFELKKSFLLFYDHFYIILMSENVIFIWCHF